VLTTGRVTQKNRPLRAPPTAQRAARVAHRHATRGPWPRSGTFDRITRLVAAPSVRALPARLRKAPPRSVARPPVSRAVRGHRASPALHRLRFGRPRVRAFALSLLGSFVHGAARRSPRPHSGHTPADRSSSRFEVARGGAASLMRIDGSAPRRSSGPPFLLTARVPSILGPPRSALGRAAGRGAQGSIPTSSSRPAPGVTCSSRIPLPKPLRGPWLPPGVYRSCQAIEESTPRAMRRGRQNLLCRRKHRSRANLFHLSGLSHTHADHSDQSRQFRSEFDTQIVNSYISVAVQG
jgi:hypothetical protein